MRTLLAMAGTLLVHVFFLFGFVLGAAVRPSRPPLPGEAVLQLRLIELAEPPPLAVRGTPPRERGPRHPGQRRPSTSRPEPAPNDAAVAVKRPSVPAGPGLTTSADVAASAPTPVDDMPSAVTPPAQVPVPMPQPVVPSRRVPALAVSLPPAIDAPLAASSSSTERPPVALATVASTAAPPAPLPLAMPRLELTPLTRATATPTPALHPAMSTSIAIAEVPPPVPASSPAVPLATPANAGSTNVAAHVPATEVAADVSRAPDATMQGRDDATPGQPTGAPAAPPVPMTAAAGAGTQPDSRSPAAGMPRADQPGAPQGMPHGSVGRYVQLKPTGDTEIMRRGAPDIGYRPTRFDKDWAPENESSVDAALRRAVEKTTLTHTFHLPRGMRIECAVKPLLPIALLGCRNPDPPAAPVADKVYDPLHLASARALASPVPAASSQARPASASAPMIAVDDSVECAVARLAGGPTPPGCQTDGHAAPPTRVPAPSPGSWVPASDQFP